MLTQNVASTAQTGSNRVILDQKNMANVTKHPMKTFQAVLEFDECR